MNADDGLGQASPSPLLAILRDLTVIAERTDHHYATLQRRHDNALDLHTLTTIACAIRDARADLDILAKSIQHDIVQTMGDREVVLDGIGTIVCRRSTTRRKWDHDELWRRVTALAVEQPGVLCDADGEILPPAVIAQQVAAVLRTCASPSWKVTGLRELGLDPGEWCEETPGDWTIQLPPRKETDA
jgi:hypothetical protein